MALLQQVPLHGFHIKHKGRMVPFAGFEMPVQYRGILEEHRAVREKVGLFDVSHMGEALVEGPQSDAFLDYILTGNIKGLNVDQALYCFLCYPDGGVVDDLIVYRKDKERYFLCLNASNTAKDIEWMEEHIGEFDCSLINVSHEYGQLALQGPLATQIMDALVSGVSQQIQRFSAKEVVLADVPVYLSRTGYTGEDGFELYAPSDKTEVLANALLDVGASYDLTMVGLGARDSLRLEAGYPLYGHEISKDITPLEAGLGWAVKLKKEADFIGKDALKRQKELGIKRKIIHFMLNDKRIGREGNDVLSDGKSVGRVVSGAMSPILNKPIGSALINSNAALSEGLAIDIRGKAIPLIIKKPPLHQS